MRTVAYLLLLAAALAAAQKTKPADKPVKAPEMPVVVENPGPNGPFAIAATPQGTYKPTMTYSFGDLVQFEENDYVSLASRHKGNKPSYASTLWLILPGHHEQATLVVTGTAIVKAQTGPVELSEQKHFQNANSYTCAPSSELVAAPPGEEPPLKGQVKAQRNKTKVDYKSGRAFEFEEVHGDAIGYICAGS